MVLSVKEALSSLASESLHEALHHNRVIALILQAQVETQSPNRKPWPLPAPTDKGLLRPICETLKLYPSP